MKSGAIEPTRVNNIIITEPVSTATITIASGKTFTCSNTLTFTGTDSSTLNIGTGGTLGTAAYLSVGTSANNIVQLDGSSRLPAVDGSQLTNISGTGKLIVEDSGFGIDNDSIGRGTVGLGAVSLEYSDTGSTYGATGDYSHSEGFRTTASGTNSHAEGWGTEASGTSSHAGGNGGSATGIYSYVEGSNCTASGHGSHAGGEFTLASHRYEWARSNNVFSSLGDCQYGFIQLRKLTESISESELWLKTTVERFTLEDNDAYTCRITLMGAQADGSVGEAVYQVKIHRQGATTALSQSVRTILAWDSDTNLGTPIFAIEADDTNDALTIKVTPANTTSTRWTAVLEYVKLNF